MPTSIKTADEILKILAQNGIKQTTQREAIVREFLSLKGHVTIDDLLLRVKKTHPAVGYATVYRTLKLLKELGFADERHFIEGKALFEPLGEGHHDHLICRQCQKIVEFENEAIEQLQEQVAFAHGFKIMGHKMEIYGVCDVCLTKS